MDLQQLSLEAEVVEEVVHLLRMEVQVVLVVEQMEHLVEQVPLETMEQQTPVVVVAEEMMMLMVVLEDQV
tara:strand:- start:73 stop:282 length:210 start_codon:yes stop_codon:yes gene_type:complete